VSGIAVPQFATIIATGPSRAGVGPAPLFFAPALGKAPVDAVAAPLPENCRMTYVVTDNCIKCKYMDCVEVCPVDCFYEGENMLVIHPDECIDCGVCEPECPAEAIVSDSEPSLERWLKLNAEYAAKWPNITRKREPPADAKAFDGVANKFETHFSPAPGEGD